MQIAPFAIAAVALLAASRGKKKKPKESTEPKVARFGRVERLLNRAALEQSDQAAVQQGEKPAVVFVYSKTGDALDRITTMMKVNAETYQTVEYYQLPLSVGAKALGIAVKLPPGAVGLLAAARGGQQLVTFIYPKDDAILARRVAVASIFAMTGIEPTKVS